MVAVLGALLALPAAAQPASQAYVDDSTLAIETLAQLDDLLRAGSEAEAARALQHLLDEEPDRLVPDGEILYIPVREAVHRRLLAEPDLLAVYSEQQAPAAARALEQGRHPEVERSRLLTPPGFEAALRVAQEHLEAARFDAAWRTLLQLEDHPAFGDRAADAARLATTAAAYLDRDPARATARDWRRRAGLPDGEIPRAPRPEALGDADRPALAPGRPATLDGIVPSPLHTATLPVAEAWVNESDRTTPGRAHWVIPVIHDRAVLINDGSSVQALDRFTLRPLWITPALEEPETTPGFRTAQRRRNRARMIEDPATVTAYDGLVLAPMGRVVNARREDDTRVLCLDRATGALRWAADPAAIADEPDEAGVRGPVVVDAGAAVVFLRKNARARRTISVWLAGLDLDDGSLLWTRPIGSVGALPYQQSTRAAQAPLAHRGTIYAVDEIGITAAVDAATGRPLWLRLTPGLDSRGPSLPWAVHEPIADADAILTLAPDRGAVLRLDARTGEILAERPANRTGRPSYLLDMGDAVAAVGESTVVFLDKQTLRETDAQRVDIAGEHVEFTGRLRPAGETILAPVHAGVLVIDPGSRQPELIPLDATGNIAAAPGQLVVVDDTRLRSYLVWDVASAMLTDRIRENPADPEPAVTFAELAHRAGKPGEIIPAIDLALQAIDRAGPAAGTAEITARLFDSTLDIVEQTQRQWLDADASPDPARAELVSGLIDRLAIIADTPAQRVAHLLALGRQQEATANPRDAAATYQRVLAEPALRRVTWRGPRLSVRGELEAERRLHELIRRAGFSVYEPYHQRALAEFRAITPPAPADAYDRIAETYPVSPVSARARLAEAELHRDAGRDRRAIRAGYRAVRTLEQLADADVQIDPDLLGRAYGVQVLALAEANRLEEASALRARADEDHPGLALLGPDGPIEAEALVEEITRRLAERRDRPRFGPKVIAEGEPQLIRGYPLRPLARAEPGGVARARFDGVLIVTQDSAELAWHAPRSENGPLEQVWTRDIDRDPLLLRVDEVSAWLFWPDETGGWLERIALADGSPMWTGSPWDTLIAGVDPPEDDPEGRFLDPVDGRVRADTFLITMDARTLLLVERAGRAAAIDASTGELLWARTLPLTRVHDVDTAVSVLAVAGAGPDRNGETGPMLSALDARTGELMFTDDTVPEEVRWTRVTGAGDLLAGLRDRIISVSPGDARTNWQIDHPQVVETDDAWLVGPRLLVRALDDDIWSADLRSGRLTPEPLETRGRITTSERVVARQAGGRLLLGSTDGVCLFDQSDALVGVDALIQPARTLPPALADDRLALLQIERGRFGVRGARYVLHTLGLESLRAESSTEVRLFGEPTAMLAIDGRLLINAGEATVVLRVPPAP